MKLLWTRAAIADLVRLHNFLEPANPRAAQAVVRNQDQGARRLVEFPRLGHKLEHLKPNEVRRLIIGDYELRYDIVGDVVRILRIWHGREDR